MLCGLECYIHKDHSDIPLFVSNPFWNCKELITKESNSPAPIRGIKSKDGVFFTSVYPQAKHREIMIKGSLFRYANNSNNGSYNEFTFKTAMETMERFSNEVQQHSENILISRFETGWNIIPNHLNSEILDGFMLLENITFKGDKNLRKFIFGEHTLKIYLKDIIEEEKGFQFPVNTIRLEQSLRGSLIGREYKIKSLNDLQNKDVYASLHSRLIAQIEKVVFFDSTIDTNLCSNKNRQFICESASNPTYWKNIALSTSQSYQRSKSTSSNSEIKTEYERLKKQFHRKKKAIKELNKKYGNDLRSILIESMNNEFERFMSQ